MSKNEINLDNFFSGEGRMYVPNEEDLVNLTLITEHAGWKVLNKVIDALTMQALDASLGTNKDDAEYNRGRVGSMYKIKRELKLMINNHNKKQAKKKA